MEEQIRQIHQESVSRVDSRPALYGDTLPGNAWSDYSLALREAANIREHKVISEAWLGSLQADVARGRELVARHGIIADHLRQGARRNQVTCPIAWERGISATIPNLEFAERLGRFAAWRARLLARDGKTTEAAQAILDLLQFSRDLSSNSDSACTEVSFAMWTIATLELKEIIFSDEYARQDLTGLEASLERLDRHLPPGSLIALNDILELGFELLKTEHGRDERIRIGLREYWRYGYSREIADADAFELLLTYHREIAPKLDGPAGSQRRLQWELSVPYRPLLRQVFTHRLIHWRGGIRYEQTILRLLRAAVHYRQTGEMLDLDDPYGIKLHHSISGSDLKVWSVGPDGVDHDGDNAGRDWSRTRPTPIPGRVSREARDIVLEVEK